jgi:XisI protein
LDNLEQYRQIIRRIVCDHVEFATPDDQVETLSICDDANGHYMLVETGWQYPRRIYNVVFHVRLKDGKVLIEQDWTEGGIARELLSAGVPADAIELRFQPPELRLHIELAAA